MVKLLTTVLTELSKLFMHNIIKDWLGAGAGTIKSPTCDSVYVERIKLVASKARHSNCVIPQLLLGLLYMYILQGHGRQPLKSGCFQNHKYCSPESYVLGSMIIYCIYNYTYVCIVMVSNQLLTTIQLVFKICIGYEYVLNNSWELLEG